MIFVGLFLHVGVLIKSIVLAGLPPAIIERGIDPLVLSATVSVGGADASGTMLWKMTASLVNGNVMSRIIF